jgi:hypothetical protein
MGLLSRVLAAPHCASQGHPLQDKGLGVHQCFCGARTVKTVGKPPRQSTPRKRTRSNRR